MGYFMGVRNVRHQSYVETCRGGRLYSTVGIAQTILSGTRIVCFDRRGNSYTSYDMDGQLSSGQNAASFHNRRGGERDAVEVIRE